MQKVGWLSAIFLIACGLPELYVGLTTGQVGSSYGLIILWFLGEVFGSIYTMHKRDYPLFANYFLNTIIVGWILLIKAGIYVR